MDRKSLAIGIAVGIAIVGCLAAIDQPEKTGEGRYQYLEDAYLTPPDGTVTRYTHAILDTETGTLNFHDSDLRGDIAATIVYPFEH